MDGRVDTCILNFPPDGTIGCHRRERWAAATCETADLDLREEEEQVETWGQSGNTIASTVTADN